MSPLPLPRPSRARTIAIGAFVLLLAAAPFVPRGGDEPGIAPSGERSVVAPRPAVTAGLGEVTPEMRAEIEAVVAQGRQATPTGRSLPGEMVRSVVRCAVFEGQRYCLGTGWTDDTEIEVQARMIAAARVAARGGRQERTGDLDALAQVRQRARLGVDKRAAKETRELVQAARSVAKVVLLRHEVLGEPLPEGFLERHPEARALPTTTAARSTAADAIVPAAYTAECATPTPGQPAPGGPLQPCPSDPWQNQTTSYETATPTPTQTPTVSATPVPTTYPPAASILDESQVAEQETTYWCGPTAMQMIGWGWDQVQKPQSFWAKKLKTGRSGTAITEMVRVINKKTGWDDPTHAGPYIALDIKKFTFEQWWDVIQRHISIYQAPVVMHPILLRKYFPYLDDDASGHFQVGRGYRTNAKGAPVLGYFEPWNQQRFDRSEPHINRVQWRKAYRSYRANQAHFQHNIGV